MRNMVARSRLVKVELFAGFKGYIALKDLPDHAAGSLIVDAAPCLLFLLGVPFSITLFRIHANQPPYILLLLHSQISATTTMSTVSNR